MRSKRSLLVFALFVLIVSEASGDQPDTSDPVDGHTALSFYLMLPTEIVQEELKLSVSQKGKIETLKDSFAKVVQGLGRSYLKLPTGERDSIALHNQILEAAPVHIPPRLKSILSKQQMTRLEQIEFQLDGIYSFCDENVAEALRLSSSQKEQIQTFVKEFNDATKFPLEMFGRDKDGNPLSSEQIEAISTNYYDNYWKLKRQTVEKAAKLLDRQQRSRLELLVGPKIDARRLSEQTESFNVMVQGRRVDGRTEGLSIMVGQGGTFGVFAIDVTPNRRKIAP